MRVYQFRHSRGRRNMVAGPRRARLAVGAVGDIGPNACKKSCTGREPDWYSDALAL